jgi:hypothetical protein
MFYESADCSGTGYFIVRATNMAFFEVGVQGTIHYFIPVTGGTIRTLNSTGSPGTFCSHVPFISPIQALVDLPVTVDFSPFGLVPPFRLSQ